MKKLITINLCCLIFLFCSKPLYAQYTIDDLNKSIAQYKNLFYDGKDAEYMDEIFGVSDPKVNKLMSLLDTITLIDYTRVKECNQCTGKGFVAENCKCCKGKAANGKYSCQCCNSTGIKKVKCDKCKGAKRIVTDLE